MTDNEIIADGFEEQKAEFERLEALNERLGNDAFKLKYIYELEERLKTISLESVKEFAYRLKKEIVPFVVNASDVREVIDNLLKEWECKI